MGASHCLAIMEGENAGVFAWGNNSHGQLGINQVGTSFIFKPTFLKHLAIESFCKQLALGENHSVFLMSNNVVMSCGSNEFGQLGLYSDTTGDDIQGAMGGRSNEYTPQPISKLYLDNVVFIAAGRYHTMAIR